MPSTPFKATLIRGEPCGTPAVIYGIRFEFAPDCHDIFKVSMRLGDGDRPIVQCMATPDQAEYILPMPIIEKHSGQVRLDIECVTARECKTVGLCCDCRHWRPPTGEKRWDYPDPDPRGRCEKILNFYPSFVGRDVVATVDGDHCGYLACSGDFGCTLFEPKGTDDVPTPVRPDV